MAGKLVFHLCMIRSWLGGGGGPYFYPSSIPRATSGSRRPSPCGSNRAFLLQVDAGYAGPLRRHAGRFFRGVTWPRLRPRKTAVDRRRRQHRWSGPGRPCALGCDRTLRHRRRVRWRCTRHPLEDSGLLTHDARRSNFGLGPLQGIARAPTARCRLGDPQHHADARLARRKWRIAGDAVREGYSWIRN